MDTTDKKTDYNSDEEEEKVFGSNLKVVEPPSLFKNNRLLKAANNNYDALLQEIIQSTI